MERKHKHILEIARALYFQAGLSTNYWGECVKIDVYLINRMPTKVLDLKSHFEVLHGMKQDLNHLRSFGCLCYVATSIAGRDKFMPRSQACIFIGFLVLKKLTK